MKILKNISMIVFTMAVTAIYGCGGGGSSTPPATPPPTKATLKLFSQYSTAGTKISGINVTVLLPPGVTVKNIPSPDGNGKLVTDTGVIVPSGKTTAANFNLLSPIGVYTPAAPGAPATVAISLIGVSTGVSGFDLGEYVTINADIEPGFFPKAIEFTLRDFTAFGFNGAPITGATSTIVPDIR